MNMGKMLLVAASLILTAVPTLAAPEPEKPCGSWKNRPPPAPADQAEDDAGLAPTPPPKRPPVEPRRPDQDGAADQDPGKRIK